MIHLLIFSGVILRVWGQPTLYPLSIHACPNETVTYNCHGSQISVIAWEVSPYIPRADPIQYAADVHGGMSGAINMNREDKFFATLTNITRLNGSVADMTTSLMIITYGIQNKTTIICLVVTRDSQEPQSSSSTLYLTDIPSFKAPSITYQEKETYFTAVLELGDMFDGGGVPIDHYIIEVDNGTQLETPGPTYNFDITYNTTLSVNISAHNCAGYSDPLPLEIQYHQEFMKKDMPSMTPGLDMPSVTPGLEKDMSSVTPRLNGSSVPMAAWLTAASVAIAVLIIMLLVTVTCAYYKRRSKAVVSIETNIRMVDSGRIDLQNNHGTSATVEYSYVPVTATRKYLERDCTGQYSTVINTGRCNSSDYFIGTYAEIELVTTSSALLPPPGTGETVQYSKRCQTPQEPVQGEVVSNEGRSQGQEDQEGNNIEPTDLHPLDKDISVHLILLQLRTVQSCWRALGEAAGLERETMDMIDRELGDDSAKLAEVMFRWYERKECVRWSDVSSLCEQIGFNQLSEAISTAYITGALPVKDDPEVELPISDKTPAPVLPPRRATSGDNEGAPAIPPHRPLISGNEGAPAVPPHRF